MSLTEEEKERIRQHPCICKFEGDCGAMYDFPHPALRCSEDGHNALDIVGLEQCLDHLYEHCPKNKEDEDEETLKAYMEVLGA